ncbi:hypothetical protein NQ315_007773 [Exocentrus adspersus]|uniref:Uncharacterized protein n=1 Tax=Exocentrus adspersus TaxID=1586481 RepID=A0AAV8W8H1_9CUCU|nr:hypothetical protein NQ315_007773 [Exocentrus adspersus]
MFEIVKSWVHPSFSQFRTLQTFWHLGFDNTLSKCLSPHQMPDDLRSRKNLVVSVRPALSEQQAAPLTVSQLLKDLSKYSPLFEHRLKLVYPFPSCNYERKKRMT